MALVLSSSISCLCFKPTTDTAGLVPTMAHAASLLLSFEWSWEVFLDTFGLVLNLGGAFTTSPNLTSSEEEN